MGGPARITIQVRDPQRGEAALAAAFEELAVLGQLLSNHRPDSEISRLNANAGRKGVQLDPRTFEVLRLAKEYHTLTEGAFDITVGSVMAAWKMYDNPDVPLLDDHRKAAKRIGVTQLRLSERLGSAHLPLSGVRIDLGGIGKGYVIDRVVERLRAAGVEAEVLVCEGATHAFLQIEALPAAGEGLDAIVAFLGRRLGA